MSSETHARMVSADRSQWNSCSARQCAKMRAATPPFLASSRTSGNCWPIYFLEVQFCALPSVYADLLVRANTYLKQHDPCQLFCGVVLFASRALEPKGVRKELGLARQDAVPVPMFSE